MRLPGHAATDYDHVCHLCQGKASKRLMQVFKQRIKRREKRAWQKEQED